MMPTIFNLECYIQGPQYDSNWDIPTINLTLYSSRVGERAVESKDGRHFVFGAAHEEVRWLKSYKNLSIH
jgi:hypothetical protein